ncbi:hypothetical protein MOMA_02560 [Moraxella macacae 0408225]|uniref:Uncharacterized protein n=1 Tax=Moraxella macacae 0408225 TaxID=1230338 RepID=L2F913_9GAMM|nr:hypothetical protein [Moraxella macacae]ELA09251.1 hypothetical protein MOMA_02560 [Moraxella macacae 0408225]
METLSWIVGIIIVIFIYAYRSGHKRQLDYQRVMADLTQQLASNPSRFFAPQFHFSADNFIGRDELAKLLMIKVIKLSLERNIRSPINANIIPSDIETLPGARQDFQKLFLLAYSIVNDRG